jgi:L-iditol 2-dehydrogenase
MRVALLVGAGQIAIEQAAVPQPGPGQVLLRVRAVGVCGSDLKYFKGHLQPGTDYPLLLGHEFTGQFVNVGPGVADWKPGDRVACAPDRPCGACEWCRKGAVNVCPNVRFAASEGVPGCLSDYYVADTSQLYAIPENLDVADAVVFEPLAIALHCVENLVKPQPGQTCAIIGCGTIGLTMLEIARLHGVQTIYAADLTQDRIDAAARLGATGVCNATDDDFEQFVMDSTDGRGVDIVLEAAGQEPAILQAFRLACVHGRVLIEGIPYVDVVPVDMTAARKKELRIVVGRRSCHMDGRALELLADGTVDVATYSGHKWPLDQAQDAFAAARDRTGGVIKSIITP